MLDRLRAHYGRGEYRTVTRLANGILLTEGFSLAEKAEAGVVGARAALHLSEPHLAKAMIEKGLGFAQAAEEAELEGHCYLVLSATLICTGDYGSARAHAQTFLAGVEERWPAMDHLSAKAHMNIAQCCRNLRLLPNSLQAFTQALTRFERQGDRFWTVGVRHQLTFVCLEMDLLDEAEEHLEQALTYAPLSEEQSCYQLEHEIALHLKRGEITKAHEKAVELAEPNRPGARPQHKVAAFYALGEVCRRLGRVHEGKTFALIARDHALQTGQSSLLNLVNTLLRELENASSDGAL